MHRLRLRLIRPVSRGLTLIAAVLVTGCATTKGEPGTDIDNRPVAIPDVVATPMPEPELETIPLPQPAPPPPPPEVPQLEPVVIAPSAFERLEGWAEADLDPALGAFRRSCESMLAANPDDWLNENLPQYGRYRDWVDTCEAALRATHARPFFETLFVPLSLSVRDNDEGLLTGYYEPELPARIEADAEFSEPILALPEDDEVLRRPRSALDATSARVIGYGRPIDVFFLQIQGSGRLKYADGRVLRVGYAGNNGYDYTS
ncbi:MAG: MltA domain-containing protein, partial [Pseudomonadota bacterium]